MSRVKRRYRFFRDAADRRLFRAALEGTVSIVRTDTCPAMQWYDSNFDIPGWTVIPYPVPGAVASLGGHVGIVGPNGDSSISVFYGGPIINNDWGFRPNKGKPVYRAYTGQ